MIDSATLTKTTLEIYKSSVVAQKSRVKLTDDYMLRAHWFLIGDAAMGVPFFRSLNAGIEGASKLIGMIIDLGIKILVN